MDILSRLSGRAIAVALAVVLLTATFFFARAGDDESRTVTAHFPRAVSIYVGSDVRILGVNVGRVTAVTPEGNSVRVDMKYDAQYKVPSDAKAVIVTPTLVADRFVQLTPAWSGGDQLMADGADIALPDTGVPVELDRIYASLRDLSEALGPNGVNKDGTLDHVLQAGAHALKGKGELGNEMLTDLAAAAQTFGEGSGDLFDTVSQLAQLTGTLADNDKVVRAFIRDLAGVSSQLVDERTEIQQALGAVAHAVGTVKSFVHDNRQALVTDVQKLTRVMNTINSERDSIDTALEIAPVAIGNLSVAFNNKSGSIGSRIGITGNTWDADGFLCGVVQQSSLPRISKDLACRLFEQLLEPVEGQLLAIPPSGRQRAPLPGTLDEGAAARSRSVQEQYVADPGAASLSGLMGGAS
jgi:phospholipid/cholesterol/gamma-HCH transport system substrate-binding protein